MDKGLIKTIILGASLIISVLIYSEANKFFIYGGDSGSRLSYSVLNTKTGEVRTYILRNEVIYTWKTTFDSSKGVRVIDSLTVKSYKD